MRQFEKGKHTLLTYSFSQRSIFKNARTNMHYIWTWMMSNVGKFKLNLQLCFNFDHNMIPIDFNDADSHLSSSHIVSHQIKISLSDKYD